MSVEINSPESNDGLLQEQANTLANAILLSKVGKVTVDGKSIEIQKFPGGVIGAYSETDIISIKSADGIQDDTSEVIEIAYRQSIESPHHTDDHIPSNKRNGLLKISVNGKRVVDIVDKAGTYEVVSKTDDVDLSELTAILQKATSEQEMQPSANTIQTTQTGSRSTIGNTLSKIENTDSNTERILTREEIVTAIERHVEKYTIQRELSDENDIYLFEVTVPGEKPSEVTEYEYQRKAKFGELETTTSHIRITYYEDEMPVSGKTLSNYEEKLDFGSKSFFINAHHPHMATNFYSVFDSCSQIFIQRINAQSKILNCCSVL